VIIDYLLYISHYLSVAPLGNTGRVIHRLAIRLEYGSRLRMENEWDGKKTLEEYRISEGPRSQSV
jgi:hypothetical protein